MNPLNQRPELGIPGAIPYLPGDVDGSVFAEPWQALAFALAARLSDAGYFTWTEWTATLAEELKAAAARGEPDNGSTYYDQWLISLEKIVVRKGLANFADLAAARQAWTEAFRDTPHGEPVELKPAAGKMHADSFAETEQAH